MFDLLYNLYLKYFSFYEEFGDVSFLYLDLRVKYLLFLSDFNDTRHIFEKHSNNKFYENPFCRSRVVPCGRADMTMLIFALRNIANASKKPQPGVRVCGSTIGLGASQVLPIRSVSVIMSIFFSNLWQFTRRMGKRNKLRH